MILLAQDYAPERKKPFYAKAKVSMFVNFEVDHNMGEISGLAIFHALL